MRRSILCAVLDSMCSVSRKNCTKQHHKAPQSSQTRQEQMPESGWACQPILKRGFIKCETGAWWSVTGRGTSSPVQRYTPNANTKRTASSLKLLNQDNELKQTRLIKSKTQLLRELLTVRGNHRHISAVAWPRRGPSETDLRRRSERRLRTQA